jgi:hypothetical protein
MSINRVLKVVMPDCNVNLMVNWLKIIKISPNFRFLQRLSRVAILIVKLCFDRYLLHALDLHNIRSKTSVVKLLFCGEDLNFTAFSKNESS